MKIYIPKLPAQLQPPPQSFLYPAHNPDYGVEQDFFIWIEKNPQFLTTDANLADWHYLPVFWTRWHINHGFAANGAGLADLENLVKPFINKTKKTFTITQFDGGTLLNNSTILEFTAARTVNSGIDIPILCAEHRLPLFPVKKKYLGSFNGSFNTHPLRDEMKKKLESNNEILIGGNLPTGFIKRTIQGKQFNLNTLASYIAMCPRGTSCNSFRFYEAMQLGVAPCLIGDVDARPFKKFLHWDDFSYYVKDIKELEILLSTLDKAEAVEKGKMARKVFYQDLYYQKWCQYVIKELDERS